MRENKQLRGTTYRYCKFLVILHPSFCFFFHINLYKTFLKVRVISVQWFNFRWYAIALSVYSLESLLAPVFRDHIKIHQKKSILILNIFFLFDGIHLHIMTNLISRGFFFRFHLHLVLVVEMMNFVLKWIINLWNKFLYPYCVYCCKKNVVHQKQKNYIFVLSSL